MEKRLLREYVVKMQDFDGRPSRLTAGWIATFQKNAPIMGFISTEVGRIDNRIYFPNGDDKFALFATIAGVKDCIAYMQVVGEALGLGYEFYGEDEYSIRFRLTTKNSQ